jgi:hypothetical protein
LHRRCCAVSPWAGLLNSARAIVVLVIRPFQSRGFFRVVLGF